MAALGGLLGRSERGASFTASCAGKRAGWRFATRLMVAPTPLSCNAAAFPLSRLTAGFAPAGRCDRARRVPLLNLRALILHPGRWRSHKESSGRDEASLRA